MSTIEKNKIFSSEEDMNKFLSDCGIGIHEVYIKNQLPGGKWMLVYTTIN